MKKQKKYFRNGVYNLKEQLDRDTEEAIPLHKTDKGQWWFIPRQRLQIRVRPGKNLRDILAKLLKSRHSVVDLNKTSESTAFVNDKNPDKYLAEY